MVELSADEIRFIVYALGRNAGLVKAVQSAIEKFPGDGRVTCRACDSTFREDDPLSHSVYCPVSAALRAEASRPSLEEGELARLISDLAQEAEGLS